MFLANAQRYETQYTLIIYDIIVVILSTGLPSGIHRWCLTGYLGVRVISLGKPESGDRVYIRDCRSHVAHVG